MKLRQAQPADADRVWELLEQARAFLRRNGTNQWQGEYPNRDTVADDIRQGHAYLLCEDEQILGTVSVIFGREESYEALDGRWLSEREYAVLHRLAVDDGHKGRGLAAELLRLCEALCLERGVRSVRTDTDESNPIMQRLLSRQGYTRCGVVLFESAPRTAYEKLL